MEWVCFGWTRITERQSTQFQFELAIIAELANVSRAAPEACSGFCFVGNCPCVLFRLVSKPGHIGRRCVGTKAHAWKIACGSFQRGFPGRVTRGSKAVCCQGTQCCELQVLRKRDQARPCHDRPRKGLLRNRYRQDHITVPLSSSRARSLQYDGRRRLRAAMTYAGGHVARKGGGLDPVALDAVYARPVLARSSSRV